MKKTGGQTDFKATAGSRAPAVDSVADAQPPGYVSLEGVHSSVEVPHHLAGFWEQWRAFVGPAILVSVGYMDPGNWGTDLAAGALFKYGLLWVVGLASLMAIFMQVISARLGVVAGKDLAQCCRDWYPAWARWPQWLFCELAIGACDLAEVLGSAVALNLMFHLPMLWAVIITGLDVLLLLGLQRFGMRTIEAVVLLLVATIASCYFIEIFVLPQTRPDLLEMSHALVRPTLGAPGMLYVAIGIIGATVMPHNLYLHSALVQSRKLQKDEASVRSAIYWNPRRQQRQRFAHVKPGGARAAAAFCHVPAFAFHQFPGQNGQMETRARSVDCRMVQRNRDHGYGSLRLAGIAQSRMASHHREMIES